MKRRVLSRVATAVLALGLCSCDGGGTAGPGPGPTGPEAVASVELSPETADIQVGQTLQLTATTKDASGNVLSGRTITWASDDPLVATVSTTGLVAGVQVGFANIIASSEGKAGTSQVSVPPVWGQLSAGGSHTCGIKWGGSERSQAASPGGRLRSSGFGGLARLMTCRSVARARPTC